LSPLVRALIIASAAAAVGLATVLGPRAAWYPTLIAAALAALLSWRAPAIVPPVIVSCLFLMPVASFGLKWRWHFSDLTPALGLLVASLAVAIPRTATVSNPWRAVLACWALVVAVSWPIVALREIDFSWPLLWTFRVPTAAGGFPPPAVVGWTAHVAASQLVGLLWFEYLWAVHPGAGAVFKNRVAAVLGITALAASALSVYQGFVDLEFLSSSVWPYLRRSAGALMDANSSGMLAAMWLTGFIALAASSERRGVRALRIVGAVAAALATWCSGSRSAFLAAAIGIGVTFIGSVQIVRYRRRAVLTALAVLAVAILILTFSQSTSPLARIVATGEGSPIATARSLWNRHGYGPAAVHMIREFPVAGVGLGTYHSLVADYSKAFVGIALPPDNAQNWYRHQLAELGIIGSAGWIAFVGLFVVAAFRARAAPEHQLAANALRGSLAGLAIASLVGMPGQHPAIVLTFWTFAFWLLQVVGVETTVKGRTTTTLTASAKATAVRRSFMRRRKGRTTSIIVGAIVALHAATTLYTSRHALRVPFRAARFDFDYSYGFVREEGSPHAWVQDRAVAVPRATTRSMRLILWSESGNEARPVSTEISIDGRRVIRRTLRGDQRLAEVVSVPGDNRRFVLDVEVSSPANVKPRPRLATQWEFLR
jgi:O-antigen ligase